MPKGEHQPPTPLSALEIKANALPYMRDPSRLAGDIPVACGFRCPGCPSCGKVVAAYREFFDGLVEEAFKTCRISPSPVETLLTTTPGTYFARAIAAKLQVWRDETYKPERDGGEPKGE